MKVPSMLDVLRPLADIIGVDEEFFDLIPKVKIKEATFDTDEESLSVYATVAVEDKESLDALVKLLTVALDKLKVLNEG